MTVVMQKISDNIYYIGVNDEEKGLFEGMWPLHFGISYNSYLVVDTKVALIDTVDKDCEEEFLDNINDAIGDRLIDYLVVNHMEPDHSSLIPYIMERYPKLKIVANAKTLPMLKGYYDISEDRIIVVGEGDRLCLGRSHLVFYMIPMVHWPETMATWLPEQNTVFSGDAFGSFGSLGEEVVGTEDTFEQFRDEMIRYYSNIVGKYGVPVQSALKKMAALPIKRICSTHGPVWVQELSKVVDLYDRLSRYEAERGVCIVYGSMYGNTTAAAEALALQLESRRMPCIMHELPGVTGISGALRDLFKYDTLVVGSPTYNNGILPPVEAFMRAMQSRLVKGRRFYAFGSYTWSPSSVSLLNQIAESMGYKILGDGLAFPQAYSPDKFNAAAIADLICNL